MDPHTMPHETAVRLALSRETLEATPGRALKLLRGIGSSLVIRATLLQVGFTRADLEEGWALLREACHVTASEDEPDLGASSQALCTLDAWDERGFVLVEATLSHRYPSQKNFLLSGLASAAGPEAAHGVAALLDRLDALESDATREEHREDDLAALELLAKRGLHAAERACLRELVRVVQLTTGAAANTRTQAGEDLARLSRLRAWFDEWSALARVTLTRAEHLRRLGLAG